MNDYQEQHKSHKGAWAVFIILLAILIVGFFVYPKIGYQKGETVPSQVTGVSVTEGDTELAITWDAPADGGSAITSYKVKVVSGREDVVDTKSSKTSYTKTKLTNGTEYTISVAAVNAIGDGEYSEEVTATPSSGVSSPDAPTELSATAGDEQVDISWTAPENDGGSSITSYQVVYGVGKDTTTVDTKNTDTTYSITGLENNTEITITVAATNSEGTGTASSSATATPSVVTGPTISALTVTPGSTGADFTWSTDEDSSSQVWYGLTNVDGEGKSSAKINTTPRVKGHTVTLSGLIPCSTYLYKALSTNASSGETESEKSTFTTTGCPGSADIEATAADQITVASGGEVETSADGKSVTVNVPAGAYDAKSEVFVQANILEETAKSGLSLPSGKDQWVSHAVEINAFDDADTEITGNASDYIDVTIEYTDEDIAGLDENTLTIWHHDGSSWSELGNCLRDTDANSITCKTLSFSTFGIFGSSSSSGGSSGSIPGAGSSSSSSSSDDVDDDVVVEEATIEEVVVVTEETTEEVSTQEDPSEEMDSSDESSSQEKTLTQGDLWHGQKDGKVKLLQKFLNEMGFIVAEDGNAGSPGNETDFFGPHTRAALIKFQEENSRYILAPLGLTRGTGFFGPFTRAFIQMVK